jgi:hypothetical protein
VEPVRYVPQAALSGGVRVLTYPEASAADFAALLGAENVLVLPQYLQVRSASGEWCTLQPGWMAGVDDNGMRHIFGAHVISSGYEPA